MMKSYALICSLLLCLVTSAQDIYSPILSAGELPEDFILKSSEKYSDAVDNLDDYDYRETASRKEFLLQSNFSIDNMLHGGQILFNDSVTNFVNKVVDLIYETNPDLPKDLRFYVMRSSATNAFSTNQGIVFITTGLISQLENEAQMAFILCHEISHYIKEHTIQGFLERKQNSRKINNRGSYDAYAALMSKYSKGQEFEADSDGWNYFVKTPYDHNEAYTAFDVLHYSYLPFDELPFDEDFFSSSYFLIRKDLRLDSINPIDVFNEDYDDSESSHPNVWKRKEKMNELINSGSQKSGQWFLVGESEFLGVRDLCRREGIRINLLQGQFHRAIYNSYLLLHSEFNDEFAKISIAKALYGLQQYDAFGELREVLPRTKYVEGESSRLVHFLNELEEEELAVLAVQHIYEIAQTYPDNVYYNSLLEDAVYDMVHEQELLYEEFHSELPKLVVKDTIRDSLIQDSLSIEEDLEHKRKRSGKYGKIEQAKIETVATEEGDLEISSNKLNDFYRYGFVKLLEDDDFKSYFKQVSNDYLEEEEQNSSLSSREKWARKKYVSAQLKKRNERILKNGTSLNIDRAIIYDPDVFVYDVKGNKQYLNSEKHKVDYSEFLISFAEKEGLEYDILSFESTPYPDTEFYNTMSFLSAWSYETGNLEEYEVQMIPSEGEYISSVINASNKKYLVMTSLLYFPEKRVVESTYWAYSVLFFPVLPITIAVASTRVKNNIHYLKVMDLETGELIHRSFRDLNVKLTPLVIKGVAFDTVQQLSRE